ncbi:MAG: FAD-dependent oxidoreductase [Bradyrhizobiaceae bacterium]|nr:FAD-dependent oxidoreductase [Bradyrhizobiaceae bacterium]
MSVQSFSVKCCIAGGGPAGLMAGLLLARAGVDVIVLEKHKDFLRDFRGDTIHPSTLEVMGELGLAEKLLKLPHQKVRSLSFQAGEKSVVVADFNALALRFPFVAIMPQWDFLNFVAKEAARFASFNLMMEAEAISLIEKSGRTAGLRARTPNGEIEVRADLVIAADGRHSVLRKQADLQVTEIGAPMDVLWFRLARQSGDPSDVMGRFGAGAAFIMIDRGDYWQCGYLIAKGGLDDVRMRGLEDFRRRLAELAPLVRGRVDALKSWDDIKLLTVAVDRLVQWYRPGFICIGDAAHAMSPIGGVGINLAIQDAVAAANMLAAPLREGRLTVQHLRQLQHRRELPARLTQMLQVFIQNRVLKPVLAEKSPPRLPLPMRLLARFPALRRFPARFVGVGIRPEHVQTKAAG